MGHLVRLEVIVVKLATDEFLKRANLF